MAWFTRDNAASEPDEDTPTTVEPAPARPPSAVFEPQPLDDDGWDDVVVKPGDDLPPYKAPAVFMEPAEVEAKAVPAGKSKVVGKAKASPPPLEPPRPARTEDDRTEDDRRTPLQKHLAEIAGAHKDGPIEEMIAPIREALIATGRDVPDDWILAIAEGLRRGAA